MESTDEYLKKIVESGKSYSAMRLALMGEGASTQWKFDRNEAKSASGIPSYTSKTDKK